MTPQTPRRCESLLKSLTATRGSLPRRTSLSRRAFRHHAWATDALQPEARLQARPAEPDHRLRTPLTAQAAMWRLANCWTCWSRNRSSWTRVPGQGRERASGPACSADEKCYRNSQSAASANAMTSTAARARISVLRLRRRASASSSSVSRISIAICRPARRQQRPKGHF